MIGAAILLVLAAGGDQAASGAAKPSLQAQFDAASAAVTEGKCEEAIEAFGRLAALPAVQKSATVSAMLKVRRGICLARLGREAEADLRGGLAVIDANPDFRTDAAQAHLALGRIAYRYYDYPAAKAEFLTALGKLDPAEKFEPLLWLTRVTMFDPGNEALGYADQALALAAAAPQADKHILGDMHTLHARVLLNHGEFAKAYAELKTALKEQGGLGLKVDMGDVITRSDLALAALLNKEEEAARQYLAYTGAGRMKTPFAKAASMDLPPCGGADGLQPDDVAVVEFGIGDDGAVAYATPIYASRNGPVALGFARAVADWSWKPEEALQVPMLFRAVTRVELRCTTAIDRPSITTLLRRDLDAWMASERIEPFAAEGLTDAQQVGPAKAELARRRAAGGGKALLPLLVALGNNPVLPGQERSAYMAEAANVAAAARAPVSGWTSLALDSQINTASATEWGRKREEIRSFQRSLLARPEVAGDGRASAALRVLISEPAFHAPAPDDATLLLQQAANDKRLAAGDSLRQAALVRLAALQAKAGDLAAARASYQLTGLDAQQCALVDAKPAMRSSGASGADFPMDALRWGFGGWVKTEFDVGANGKTSAQRAVIAYPPFVFRDAALGVARDMVFEQSYRPAGGAGCGGAQQGITFRAPS